MDGTPFGRYRLIALLGSGGMGDVWRALDTRTDRMVAIKVLHAHFAKDATFEERFRREAHAVARLNNPHVIPIHDYGEIDERLFVDMRLVEGRDLHAELGKGPLTPERAVAVIDQIADALDAAHRIGLVHRDVKPSNILLDGDFAYLIDFGLARAISDTGLTITGTAVGTMDYMAPERFESKPADARSDVYSLACVLYQCLVGAKPFPTGIVEGLIAAHMFTSPPRPSEMREGLSTSFDHVIAVGMAKDPEQRFATAKELASAARDALAGRAPPTVVTPLPARKAAEPPPAKVSRARWITPAAIVAAVVLLGALAVAAVTLTGSDAGNTVATSSSSPLRPTATGASRRNDGVRPTLTGQWTGRATGDQQDVLVVVDIVDRANLSGNVIYPEIPCAGTWEQTEAQGNSRIVTETITSGTCVSSAVTLTPRVDGGLDFRSVFYAESQHRDFTIFATLYRA